MYFLQPILIFNCYYFFIIRTIHLCVIENPEKMRPLLLGRNETLRMAHQTGANVWLIHFTGYQENNLRAASAFFKSMPLSLDSNVYVISEEHKG